MTNRLELNWKLDGFVDEQRYYCSETPIYPENLPVPKAVLAGDVRTYVDTNIDVGKTYYVRIGPVKNGVEKISPEISIFAGELWTPSQLLKALWLDAADLSTVTVLNSKVSEWRDKSGNGCDFAQSQNSLMPSINAEKMLFNGANRLLGNQNALGISKNTGAISVFLVAKVSGGNDYRTLINSSVNGLTAARVAIFARATGVAEAFGRRLASDVGQSVSTQVFSDFELLAGMFDYSNASLKVGLNAVYTQKSGSFQVPGVTDDINSAYFSIGGHPTSLNENMSGEIGELIIFRDILSVGNREKVEGYLAHKWGLVEKLPIGHAYKVNPPIV